MKRTALFIGLLFAGGLFLSGCKDSTPPRPVEAPLKVTEGVSKTKNKNKSIEASFEDPPKQ